MSSKNFDAPEDTKSFPKTKIDFVEVDGALLQRLTYEPGWKWSDHIKPTVKTEHCESHHVMYVLAGTLDVNFIDGTKLHLEPGDVADIVPGHQAEVVGDEPFVALDMAGLR